MQAQQIKLSRLDIEALNPKRESSKTLVSACPNCGEGEDRFVYWPETGNYWCRICEVTGFVLEVQPENLTAEWRQRLAEARRQREADEALARQSARERIANMGPKVDFYHSQVGNARPYWYGQGLDDETIDLYRLGYSALCPLAGWTPSYVIPAYEQDVLVSIRHRLAVTENPKTGKKVGKYRPEFPDLPPVLFNTDALQPDWYDRAGLFLGSALPPGEVLLVEGEVKAMYLTAMQGLPAAGLPGINNWLPEWTGYFSGLKLVYIVLDPGPAENWTRAQEIGSDLKAAGLNVRLCSLSEKPDDFFVQRRRPLSLFKQVMKWGRPL